MPSWRAGTRGWCTSTASQLAAVDVHLVDEHNQLRSEAEILVAVRNNLITHIGMVEARIAVLKVRNDPGPAAGGEAGRPGPAAADGEAGQPGPR